MSDHETHDDEIEEEPEPLEELPRMSDEELRGFVDDLLSGRILTSAQIPIDMVGHVFMPLMLGAASHYEKVKEDIGCFWEYLDSPNKAGRAINGWPMFFSIRVIHKDDWKIALDTFKQEKTRRETIPLVKDD